ncbi:MULTISPECIES: HAD family hydrolase [Microbacterium]|uniref:HAD family hydrolase n=1 Tax=Microbacterium TaxID=33882 RepID=UPI0025EE6C66|nr:MULTISPECIES: HAD family hydrolase [Microbacterium]
MVDQVDGVLFDLDDTLLNHSGAADRAFVQWATEEHIDPNERNRKLWREAEDRFPPAPHRGVTMEETRSLRMGNFLSRAVPDRPVSEPDDLAKKYAAYLTCYEDSWELYSDTLDCVRRLRERFRVGILTNGASLMQRRKLDHTGLGAAVDLVVVSEEIGYAKPAPEAFTMSCERLGVSAGCVLYVGDNPRIDIEGAVGAGLQAALIIRDAPRGERALEELTMLMLAKPR